MAVSVGSRIFCDQKLLHFVKTVAVLLSSGLFEGWAANPVFGLRALLPTPSTDGNKGETGQHHRPAAIAQSIWGLHQSSPRMRSSASLLAC
ncbi:hypothetical protein PCC6311_1091 [Synechococcus elongatus PCC 6311]|uniref:Uncharacterized protein n=1 Tax=Synechococcus elongatus (strain ATCC 33912 / PCC 7942 / FACHB-805) TaxID=1140 RepID=Q31PE8_SYNE7|nr:hypothetical protein Synpcc7942_1041 [Synechococcus elongatus PCC 7942 = FACHB-805]UOW70848.1 hypothetical protein PCC7943_1091 [Synechococcus elongatus PCC 7943]UOW73569.1 hypothetical protein PCC6311_1091 [Synechococcus elongatus PCC 6311]UOW76289.1 hypothetical protein PCC6301pg_1091 [Synechococcus elongatus PCC 6301]